MLSTSILPVVLVKAPAVKPVPAVMSSTVPLSVLTIMLPAASAVIVPALDVRLPKVAEPWLWTTTLPVVVPVLSAKSVVARTLAAAAVKLPKVTLPDCTSKSVLAEVEANLSTPLTESTSMFAPVLVRLLAVRPVPAERSTQPDALAEPKSMVVPASALIAPALTVRLLMFTSPSRLLRVMPVVAVRVCALMLPARVLTVSEPVLVDAEEICTPCPAVIAMLLRAEPDNSLMPCPACSVREALPLEMLSKLMDRPALRSMAPKPEVTVMAKSPAASMVMVPADVEAVVLRIWPCGP